MHRRSPSFRDRFDCFPRRRGDAPQADLPPPSRLPFPPQARGCTVVRTQAPPPHEVSPAGAGMHPDDPDQQQPGLGFPRRRGDAPHVDVRPDLEAVFPPQARGCTEPGGHHQRRQSVSPAGAGMHPVLGNGGYGWVGFPRRRGDAPTPRSEQEFHRAFPPQARGCTLDGRRIPGLRSVSPAGAGMHRPSRSTGRASGRFPRRRGDAPSRRSGGRGRATFPPQARGCTRPPPLRLG